LLAETLRVYVPAAVPTGTVKASVGDGVSPDSELASTETGLKAPVTPAGSPETLMFNGS
jgi:hypothetical protein